MAKYTDKNLHFSLIKVLLLLLNCGSTQKSKVDYSVVTFDNSKGFYAIRVETVNNKMRLSIELIG